MFGFKKNKNKEVAILAPLEGNAVPLKEVSDPTFAEEMLGKGIAIKPTGNRVVSPVKGTISSIFDTGHAVALTSDDGAEILIHVGLDTVQLNGKHFNICAKSGDSVKPGDLLIEFDREAIIEEGYDVITPVIICNSADYQTFHLTTGQAVKEQDSIMQLGK